MTDGNSESHDSLVSADDATDTIRFHRFLLGKTGARLEQYRQAIAEAIRPDDVVLDLGAGVGLLAFFACRAGARRVYAVETGPIAEWAKVLARENGFSDRVVFVRGASREIDLPERVDAIVTDTFGPCGLQSGGLGALIDARERFLKPGAIVIPGALDVVVAPVELPVTYQEVVEFWNGERHGIDLSALKALAVNGYHGVSVERRALLAEPVVAAHLEFGRLDSAHFAGEREVAIERAGTCHGLCVWFQATLVNELSVGNRPETTSTNYQQGFFPVAQPTAVEEGDRLTIGIRSFDNYQWRWRMAVERCRGGAGPPVRFDQSTFLGFPPARVAG